MRPSFLLPALLALTLAPAAVHGHGRLTMPAPRDNANCEYPPPVPHNGNSCVEDPDGPVNLGLGSTTDGWPVNNPIAHPEGQSLVCRVANGKSTRAVIDVTAGTQLSMKWEYTAAHPGDGGLYVTYDALMADTQQMRFFKIANFPQARRNNNQVVQVNLPDWLPPGRAVIRWDWYATHNPPWTEFYSNCIDVNIVSTSTVSPDVIPKYIMQSGANTATSYPAYDDTSAFCVDCPAADQRQHYIAKGGIVGPQCVEGVTGNCCDIVNDYAPSAVDFDAGSGGGFNVCANSGYSGVPSWMAPGSGTGSGTGTGTGGSGTGTGGSGTGTGGSGPGTGSGTGSGSGTGAGPSPLPRPPAPSPLPSAPSGPDTGSGPGSGTGSSTGPGGTSSNSEKESGTDQTLVTGVACAAGVAVVAGAAMVAFRRRGRGNSRAVMTVGSPTEVKSTNAAAMTIHAPMPMSINAPLPSTPYEHGRPPLPPGRPPV